MPNWYKSHSLESKTKFPNCRAEKHGEITFDLLTRKLETKPNLRRPAVSRRRSDVLKIDAGLRPAKSEAITQKTYSHEFIPRSAIRIKRLLVHRVEKLSEVEKDHVRDCAQDAIGR
jgi:hypothetical protein